MRFSIAASILILVVSASSSANAAIVIYDANVTLSAANFDSYDLDIDNNGTNDFTFTAVNTNDPSFLVGFNTVDFAFGSSNAVVIDGFTGDGFPTATRLATGDSVSSSLIFSGPNDQGNLFFITPFDLPSGNFEGQTGFLGLRFDGPGGTFFGFAQITVNALNSPTDPLGLRIGYVGYETVPGQALTITGVPEPSSLVLCGVGIAAAIGYRWRSRRKSLGRLQG